MKVNDLKATLALAQSALEQNKTVFTPDVLALLVKLQSVLQLQQTYTERDDSEAYQVSDKLGELDLSKVIQALGMVIRVETQLQANGLQDAIVASLVKIQSRPVEMAIISPFI